MGNVRKVVALAAVLLLAAGCGGGPEVHPVRGRIVLKDGDVGRLADAHVEFELRGAPKVRADGLIAPDGRFEVQALHRGQVLKGMPAGTYWVRLVLDDESKGAKKARPLPVSRQFLRFDTSGLSVTVPAPGDVTVTVARR
jgi:hypothetical protein